jgi:hypothetical protein
LSADVLSDGGPNLTTNSAVAGFRQTRDFGGEVGRNPRGNRDLGLSVYVVHVVKRLFG